MSHWKHLLWLGLYVSIGLIVAGVLAKVVNISSVIAKITPSTTS